MEEKPGIVPVSYTHLLYIPKGYSAENQYPLLMFIPDATAPGKTSGEIVEQYFGADIWVTDEEQAKHPSFVLVPNFAEVVVNEMCIRDRWCSRS